MPNGKNSFDNRSLWFVLGIGIVLLSSLLPAGDADAGQGSSLKDLSFDELLDVTVVSVSRTTEKISEAPATVIVITRKEIQEFGYTELSQILDDLPGMQVIRPYGATYFKNYWRGYRTTIGAPYLFLVDGIVMNHLYFNSAHVMASVPLANIERIEVVYGPASSVYGGNASMGVINVITRTDSEFGFTSDGYLASGSSDLRVADVRVGYRKEKFGLSLTARFEDGDILNNGENNEYEYSSDSYYGDRQLWGGFVDDPSIAGRFSSPRENRGLDLRLRYGEAELGLLYYMLSTGYGLEYAGDRALSLGAWKRPDLSLFFRFNHTVNDRLESRTVLRYRESDVSNDSFWIESLTGDDLQRQIRSSYWRSINSSWSFFQDFDIQINERCSLTAGLKYERKDLQKAYDISYGPALPPNLVDAETYPYPDPPIESEQAQNRISTDDIAAFVQARWRVVEGHVLHFGIRRDDNSQYGGATTIRAGYVGSVGRLTLKAMYGEAFQEPVPRVLYGGWTGSGSDPELDPETSHTVELSANYATSHLSTLLSLYSVASNDVIVNTTEGAQNSGARKVDGMDLHLDGSLVSRDRWGVRLWTYFSHIFTAQESKIDDQGNSLGDGRVGDLADNQLIFGISGRYGDHLNASLRLRSVQARETVDTNPIDEVGSFTTTDVVITFENLFAKNLAVSLKINNILNESYFHPGVREADAGIEPGFFDEDHRWHGSAGYYNSVLPQPGRSFVVLFRYGL